MEVKEAEGRYECWIGQMVCPLMICIFLMIDRCFVWEWAAAFQLLDLSCSLPMCQTMNRTVWGRSRGEAVSYRLQLLVQGLKCLILNTVWNGDFKVEL